MTVSGMPKCRLDCHATSWLAMTGERDGGYFRKASTDRPLASMMFLSVPMGMILEPCTGTMTCLPFGCLHF